MCSIIIHTDSLGFQRDKASICLYFSRRSYQHSKQPFMAYSCALYCHLILFFCTTLKFIDYPPGRSKLNIGLQESWNFSKLQVQQINTNLTENILQWFCIKLYCIPLQSGQMLHPGGRPSSNTFLTTQVKMNSQSGHGVDN